MTVEAILELPSPLGALAGRARGVITARAKPFSPPEDLKIVAGPVEFKARVALPSPLEAPAVVGHVPRSAQLSLPSPLGALRVAARVIVDNWGGGGGGIGGDGGCDCPVGFPLPRLQDYSYQKDAGLVRTKMLSGGTLQRRKWTSAYRQATVSFEICTSRLYDMEAFIDAQGYDWFGMALVTGDNAAETAEIHQVRIIADPSYGSVYGENITVTLTISITE